MPSVRPASRWDHPRACGEQPSYGEHMAHLSGSSPRVRGADLDTVVSLLVDGIIPACAGSSPTTPSAPSTRWDHPRACGEQFSLRMAQLALSGSSPRVRGADLDGGLGVVCHGIIPARAGSSLPLRLRYLPRRDHPRACGEQVPYDLTGCTVRGSSPRVRGAVNLRHVRRIAGGIIPARAGSSRGGRTACRPRWDHPRACGEQSDSWSTLRKSTGSSPRVRGAV